LHTPLCKHAVGTVEEYIQEGIKKGIQEIGIADHIPMPPDYDAKYRMGQDEFDSYLALVRRGQEKFPEYSVKLGIEADYYPPYLSFVENFLSEYRFDYVIGSVHYIGTWGFDNPEYISEYNKRDIIDVYKEYFRHVREMAQTGLFDIIGHFDLVKKFGFRPDIGYLDIAKDALIAIRDSGCCIELNTSGLWKEAQETYPSIEIIHEARALGIPITLGSDAHRPEEVGAYFDVAVRLKK